MMRYSIDQDRLEVRMLTRLAMGMVLAATTAVAAFAAQSKPIQDLNDAFVRHVQSLGSDQKKAAAVILANRDKYRENAEGFVPDSLALLYPQFRDAIAAFDEERYSDVSATLRPMIDKSSDPYLIANGNYYVARSMVERGLFEEAEKTLLQAVPGDSQLESLTPYAAHLWFLKGFCQASNLRFAEAAESLRRVEKFADAPEPILVGAKQLLLEVERREVGTLGEVSGLMNYAGERLKVTDASVKTRQRQDEAVALLDKLIKEAEQQEKQGSSGGGGKGGRKRGAQRRPSNPAQQSEAPAGAGQIGDLHDPGKANPGEMWGKLPPAERERILQSLRSRFPSRYRELVEQYYRSLAEEK